MYHNNIDLILTFIGLFLITNVIGTPEASNLAKNPTTLRSNIPPDHFKFRGFVLISVLKNMFNHLICNFPF